MGKKQIEKTALVERKQYSVKDAAVLLTQVSITKFDGTAEAHIVLATDPTQGDQQVRSTISLPHGTGKKVRIAAIVPEDFVRDALAAGATKAGEAELIKEIEQGKLDFDIVVAVPAVMKNLGKVAKILGQKGLMPSPKAGTVSDDPAKMISELQKGRIEFRADKQGIIHAIFGKLSFGAEKLEENLRTLLQAILDARPAALKGDYIKTITIAPSMGPGIRVDARTIK